MAAFTPTARRVLGEVRSAYGALLEALGRPERAADLQSVLSLDKKLAWRVQRLTATNDPLEAAPFVPSGTSAARVVRAARSRGVAAAVGNQVLEATRAFEALVEDRAEDRYAFEAMAAASAGKGLGPILDDARRSAYRANVLLHGRASEAMVFAFLVVPGPGPDRLSGVSLRGHVGLQLLRSSASTEIARHRFDSSGAPLASASSPLDPEAAARLGAPILPSFGTPQPSELQHVEVGEGFRRTYLTGSDLGQRAARTFLLGDRSDDLPLDEEALGSLCEVSTPTRRLIHDFLIHDQVPVEPPELRTVLSRREAGTWPAPDAPGVLPADLHVADLGTGLQAADLPAWPRHAELLQLGVEALGVDPGRMRLHRVVVEYPVLHSVVWLRARRRS